MATVAAAAATAQTASAVRTLYAPPMNQADKFHCAIVNSSADAVTVNQFRFVSALGAVPTAQLCGAVPITLQPGGYCLINSVDNQVPGAPAAPVACRVQHTGSETAILGALSAFHTNPAYVSRGAVPLRLLSGHIAP